MSFNISDVGEAPGANFRHIDDGNGKINASDWLNIDGKSVKIEDIEEGRVGSGNYWITIRKNDGSTEKLFLYIHESVENRELVVTGKQSDSERNAGQHMRNKYGTDDPEQLAVMQRHQYLHKYIQQDKASNFVDRFMFREKQAAKSDVKFNVLNLTKEELATMRIEESKGRIFIYFNKGGANGSPEVLVEDIANMNEAHRLLMDIMEAANEYSPAEKQTDLLQNPKYVESHTVSILTDPDLSAEEKVELLKEMQSKIKDPTAKTRHEQAVHEHVTKARENYEAAVVKERVAKDQCDKDKDSKETESYNGRILKKSYVSKYKLEKATEQKKKAALEFAKLYGLVGSYNPEIIEKDDAMHASVTMAVKMLRAEQGDQEVSAEEAKKTEDNFAQQTMFMRKVGQTMVTMELKELSDLRTKLAAYDKENLTQDEIDKFNQEVMSKYDWMKGYGMRCKTAQDVARVRKYLLGQIDAQIKNYDVESENQATRRRQREFGIVNYSDPLYDREAMARGGISDANPNLVNEYENGENVSDDIAAGSEKKTEYTGLFSSEEMFKGIPNTPEEKRKFIENMRKNDPATWLMLREKGIIPDDPKDYGQVQFQKIFIVDRNNRRIPSFLIGSGNKWVNMHELRAQGYGARYYTSMQDFLQNTVLKNGTKAIWYQAADGTPKIEQDGFSDNQGKQNVLLAASVTAMVVATVASGGLALVAGGVALGIGGLQLYEAYADLSTIEKHGGVVTREQKEQLRNQTLLMAGMIFVPMGAGKLAKSFSKALGKSSITEARIGYYINAGTAAFGINISLEDTLNVLNSEGVSDSDKKFALVMFMVNATLGIVGAGRAYAQSRKEMHEIVRQKLQNMPEGERQLLFKETGITGLDDPQLLTKMEVYQKQGKIRFEKLLGREASGKVVAMEGDPEMAGFVPKGVGKAATQQELAAEKTHAVKARQEIIAKDPQSSQLETIAYRDKDGNIHVAKPEDYAVRTSKSAKLKEGSEFAKKQAAESVHDYHTHVDKPAAGEHGVSQLDRAGRRDETILEMFDGGKNIYVKKGKVASAYEKYWNKGARHAGNKQVEKKSVIKKANPEITKMSGQKFKDNRGNEYSLKVGDEYEVMINGKTAKEFKITIESADKNNVGQFTFRSKEGSPRDFKNVELVSMNTKVERSGVLNNAMEKISQHIPEQGKVTYHVSDPDTVQILEKGGHFYDTMEGRNFSNNGFFVEKMNVPKKPGGSYGINLFKQSPKDINKAFTRHIEPASKGSTGNYNTEITMEIPVSKTKAGVQAKGAKVNETMEDVLKMHETSNFDGKVVRSLDPKLADYEVSNGYLANKDISVMFLEAYNNSTKYGHGPGGVKIQTELSPDKKFVRVKFSDNGSGFSKEMLDKACGYGVTTRHEGENGLGLNLILQKLSHLNTGRTDPGFSITSNGLKLRFSAK